MKAKRPDLVAIFISLIEIDEDYNFVGDSEKFIKKHTTLLSKAKKVLSKQLKKKGK